MPRAKRRGHTDTNTPGECTYDNTQQLSSEIARNLALIAPVYKDNQTIQDFISNFQIVTQDSHLPYAMLQSQLRDFADKLVQLIIGHNEAAESFISWAIAQGTMEEGTGSGPLQTKNDTPEYKCSDPLSGGALRFADIQGAVDVKMDIQNNYLLPQQFPMIFPTDTDGILFYGPPGTGKTMFAKAASAELGHTAFYAPSAGSIRDKYEGGTEKNISALFECARMYVEDHKDVHRAIIFIDEFDSIAGLRGEDASMTRSVNVLLQEMDGINSTTNISVIAATNYPWLIDSAVQRRFSEKIMVDLPDALAKKGMIEDALKKYFCRHHKDPHKIGNVYNEIKKMNHVEDGKLVDEDFVLSLVGLKKTSNSTKNGNGDLYQTKEPIQRTNMVNNKVGDKFIEQVAKNSGTNPEHFRDATFGYSGSDISKMMGICAKRCGRRIFGGSGNNNPLFKKHDEGIDTKQVYALITYKTLRGNSKTTGTVPLSEIKLSDHDKIINTIITKQDMMEAIASYAPTTKAETYMQLLLYKYHGIAPEQ